MNDKYLIKTTMGDTLTDPGKSIYVQVDNRHFLRKRPYELSVGDMLVFPKPFARAQIEDVEPYLFRSPRYQKAWDIVHETNGNGEHIPRLRTLLIRGMRENGLFGENIDDEEFDRKLMKEGTDFSTQEYQDMETYLREVLVRYPNIHIGSETPQGWLKGHVRAPFNFSATGAGLLEVFGYEINPEFQHWRYKDDDNNGFYFNYRLQNVIRSRIMWYLNECRGTHVGKAAEEDKGEDNISISPEYDIVFQHFFHSISKDLASTRVTGIERLDSNRKIRNAQEHALPLFEGILFDTVQFLDSSRKGVPEVFEDFEVMTAYLEAVTENYDYAIRPIPVEMDDGSRGLEIPSRWETYMCFPYSLPFLLMYFKEELDDNMNELFLDMLRLEGREPRETTTFRENLAMTINDIILDGSMDRHYGYQRGMMMSLLEAYYRVRRSLPPVIHNYCASVIRYKKRHTDFEFGGRTVTGMDGQSYDLQIRNAIPKGRGGKAGRERKNAEKELARMRRHMRNEFDMHFDGDGENTRGGVFLSQALSGALGNRTLVTQGDVDYSPREILARTFRPEMIEGVRRDILKHGVFLRTREHTGNILSEYGLDAIVDQREEDFIWEQFDI